MKMEQFVKLNLYPGTLVVCLTLTACGRGQNNSQRQDAVKPEAARAEEEQSPTKSKVVAKPLQIDVKAASIQIIDGDKVGFRGASGVGATMDPSEIIPILPCIWIVKGISEGDKATAEMLGVEEGNAYMQLEEESRKTTFFGRLPSGKTLWHIKAIDGSATPEQLFVEFAGMMKSN